jgi:hypothetical protein
MEILEMKIVSSSVTVRCDLVPGSLAKTIGVTTLSDPPWPWLRPPAEVRRLALKLLVAGAPSE